jgi:CRP/FNR family cyclic AMP-dependent transcriptional regulator
MMPASEIDISRIPSANPRAFAAGEHIIREGGAPATEMFIVRSGRVLISLDGKPIEETGPGGVIGEMALLDHGVRSAEAVALEATELLPISERLFLILVQDTPGFALEIMRALTQRLRRMNELVDSPRQ